jgi:hypothetical protein
MAKKMAPKKGGMKGYEKSKFDAKADKSGKHGKEGSAKDMKADKKAAKRLGYI